MASGIWLACLQTSQAISTLSTGDVAIVGFNASGDDDFSFVTLVDIDGSVDFTFNEDGASLLTYRTPPAGLLKGTVVAFLDTKLVTRSVTIGTIVSVTGAAWGWSASGDILEAKQSGSPLYTAETESIYTIPAGLSAAQYTVVSHPDLTDNGRYTGPRSGTRGELLAAIANTGLNWEYRAAIEYPLNISPYIDTMTVTNLTGGGAASWTGNVVDGFFFVSSFGGAFFAPVTLSSQGLVANVLTDNNDAISTLSCYARPGDVLINGNNGTTFSVYFDNDFPSSVAISSLELTIQHQGEAGQSGTFDVLISTNRFQTQWYSGGIGTAHFISSNIAWNSSEQETSLDLASILNTPDKVNNCEILVMNRSTSSDFMYFDYFTLTAETEPLGAPLINNNAGANNLQPSSAILNGELEAGGPAPNVLVYWGDEPAGTTGPWDTIEHLGIVNIGSFGHVVTGLVANKTYFYRAFATNVHGDAWAPTNTSFITPGPEINFALSNSGGDENVPTVTMDIELGTLSALPVSVSYAASGGSAINGSDYNLVPGNIVIPAGQRLTNITISINDDSLNEDLESLVISLSSPTNATIGATSTHTYDITDNDPLPQLVFTNAPFSAVEDLGPALIAVAPVQESGRDLSVDFETLSDTALPGSDYTTTTGRLTWIAGDTSPKNISVPLTDDPDPENPESFQVRLQNPVNAILSGTNPENVTIIDDDLGVPVVNNASGASPVSSNTATLRGNILSTGGSETRAWIYWGTADGVTNSLDWQTCIPLGTNGVGPIQAALSSLAPNTLHYYRCLSSNLFGRAWAVATTNFLTGPPTLQFSASSSAGPENTTPVNVELSLSNPSVYGEDIAIELAVLGGTAVQGTDYTFTQTNVFIPAGTKTTNVTIDILNDNIDEFNETIILKINGADKAFVGPTANHVFTIQDEDSQPTLSFTNTPYSVNENGGSITVTVTLHAESGKNVSVIFATANGSATAGSDYVHVSGTLLWTPGQVGAKTFDVDIVNNEISAGNRFFLLRLTAPENVTISGNSEEDVIIIEDDDSGAEITNAEGARNVRSSMATLNGEVVGGVPMPEAFIYWGPDDGTTNRTAWSNCVPMGIQDGRFATEIIGLDAATPYYYRCFATNAAGTDWADETAEFTTSSAQAYYVNDSVTVGDIYCDVVGNDGNNGLTPTTPKATLQAILSTYNLDPGDTVYIDTGNYSLSSTITISPQDTGNAASNILFRGSTHPDATLLDRNNAGADVVYVDVDGDAYVTFQHLQLTGGRVGLWAEGNSGPPCKGVSLLDCEVFGNNSAVPAGIYFTSCEEVRVIRCTSYNNGWSGIGVDICTDLTISSNTCYNNGNYGIWVLSTTDPIVTHNTCYDHQGGGPQFGILIDFGSGEIVENNTCYENDDEGIMVDGDDGRINGNISYDNAGMGIDLTGSNFEMIGNRVYDNGEYGINTPGNQGLLCRNNLVYGNTTWNIRFSGSNNRIVFENNTIHGGNGVYLHDPQNVTNRHNIFWASGGGNIGLEVPNIPPGPTDLVSDYNNFYATAGASAGKWGTNLCANITNWQNVVWKDPNSMGVDSLFVDPITTRDYHLQSKAASYHDGLWTPDTANSPCIDAGDPFAEFSSEPDYNGLLRNLGAYGNTAQASETFYNGPLYSVSVSAVPPEAGTANIFPNGTLFPTNRIVTIWSTVDDVSYGWQGWTGTLVTTTITNTFYVTTNMVLQAIFAPLQSNTNGVPDWWLALHSIPVSQEGADADTDMDGHANWQEFDAGTIPTNPLSILHLTDIGPGLPRDAVSFLAVNAKLYRLQAATDLAAPVWIYQAVSLTLGGALSSTPFAGVDGIMTIYLVPPSTAPAYRIELQ